MRALNSVHRRAVVALLASAWLAGCAVEPRTGPPTGESVASRAPGVLSVEEAERAQASVAIGRSTKAQVLSALGKASAAIAFESGFEVWVYRVRSPAQAKAGGGEFVVLFAPSGLLAKTRMRPVGSSG